MKRAMQNVATTKLVNSRDVSAYDILRKKKLILDKNALSLIESRLTGVQGKVTDEKVRPKETVEAK